MFFSSLQWNNSKEVPSLASLSLHSVAQTLGKLTLESISRFTICLQLQSALKGKPGGEAWNRVFGGLLNL